MSWDQRYWDMVSNFYWNPNYMGFRSIKLKNLQQAEGELKVPLSLINTAGPLYTRSVKYNDMAAKLNRKEEVLGHLFNITFAIAPDALIAKLFASTLELSHAGPFVTLGQQDVVDRYNLAGKNVGQHDALFLSGRAAIAIELKTGSMPSVEQILKYLALFGRMSHNQDTLTEFGLLFICPQKDAPQMFGACGIEAGVITSDFIEKNIGSVNPDVQKELNACRPHLAALLNGLKVGVLTWSRLYEELCTLRAQLNQKDVFQQSLYRLLDGFIRQLERHGKTGIDEELIRRFRPVFADPEETRAWIQKLSDISNLDEPDRRKALIAYVCSTHWGTPSVLKECESCPIAELEDFVAALKDQKSPISLRFRWAADSHESGIVT